MARMNEHSTNTAPPPAGTIRRPWLAVVLLALVAALCISLGFWQFGRAGAARAMAERFAAADQAEAIELDTARASADDMDFRRVVVDGHYVPQTQLLLDNIVYQRVAGYYVLTPFAPAGGGPMLLVNRGWVPADPARRQMPDVAIDDQPRRIEGRIAPLPSAGIRLGDESLAPNDSAIVVLNFPTIGEIETVVRRDLFDATLQLDPAEPDGFVREFPRGGLEPEKHLSYAVQWWLFASIAGGAALVIAWRTVRARTLNKES